MRLAAAPRRRKPSLTPMIDVVFLLLVFFMLASRFGGLSAIPVSAGGAAPDFSGPPRLVSVEAERVRLNGVEVAEADLAAGLGRILPDPDAAIVLRPGPDASLQRLISVMELLRGAGFTTLSVVEGE